MTSNKTLGRIMLGLFVLMLAYGAVYDHYHIQEPSEVRYGELVLLAGFTEDNTVNISSPNGIVPATNNPDTILETGMGRWTVVGNLDGDKDFVLTFTGFFENLSEVPDLYVNRSHDGEYFYARNFTSETREVAGRNVTYLSADTSGTEYQLWGRGVKAIEFGIIDRDTYDHQRALLDDHNLYKDVDYMIWRSPWYPGETIQLPHTLTPEEQEDNKVWRIRISIRC